MAATRPRKRICPLSRIIAPPSERLDRLYHPD